LNQRLRAYLVDDEALAVKRLVRLLEATGRVDIVGTASDPEEARAYLSGHARGVDVAFVDIEMPGMTGLALAGKIPKGPAVVFVTAYDTFARDAFEVNAVDYLMKPVRVAALERALDKVRPGRGPSEDEKIAGMLARFETLTAPTRPMDRIASRVGNRIQLVELTRVTHFVAEDKLTCAVTADRSYVVDASIGALEERLRAAGFFRIHRRTLVNLAFVSELHGGGSAVFVKLTDAKRTELQVARDRVRELKEHLAV